MPLMLPIAAAVWILWLSSVQYSFAQRLAVFWVLLLAYLRMLRFLSFGILLYSLKAARLASITGVISAALA